MVVVRIAGPGEWATLREVRLAALREAPSAFASTHAREEPFTEEQWRGRLSRDGSVTLFGYLAVAGSGGDRAAPAGIAGVLQQGGDADLVSMWVRPAARGQGVGEALVAAAAGWAKARDHDSLYLWVTATNAPARRLYERCGFAPTGESQPLPSDPSLSEIRMSRRL